MIFQNRRLHLGPIRLISTIHLSMTPMDPVVEAYKKDVDRTLLIENLRLTTQQRSERFKAFMRLCFELQKNARTQSSQVVSPHENVDGPE